MADSDIVITTALIPGKPAPKLIDENMLMGMKPGSVVLDMAASASGGNCALSRPNEVVVTSGGVKILGYMDLPSRSPTTASLLYAKNALNFLLSAGPTTSKECKEKKLFYVDYGDPAVRGMLVLDKGQLRWPNPNPYQPPATRPSSQASPVQNKSEPSVPLKESFTMPVPATVPVPTPVPIPPPVSIPATIPATVPEPVTELKVKSDSDSSVTVIEKTIPKEVSTTIQLKETKFDQATGKVPELSMRATGTKAVSLSERDVIDQANFGVLLVLGVLLAGSSSSSPESTALLSVFLLSSFAGQQAVRGVKPALHSPLMAVTNAISGLTAVGGIALLDPTILNQVRKAINTLRCIFFVFAPQILYILYTLTHRLF